MFVRNWAWGIKNQTYFIIISWTTWLGKIVLIVESNPECQAAVNQIVMSLVVAIFYIMPIGQICYGGYTWHGGLGFGNYFLY